MCGVRPAVPAGVDRSGSATPAVRRRPSGGRAGSARSRRGRAAPPAAAPAAATRSRSRCRRRRSARSRRRRPRSGLHVLASCTVRTSSSGRPGRPSVMSRRVSLLSIQYGTLGDLGAEDARAAASASGVPSTPDARAPRAPVRPNPARVSTASRRRSRRACLFMARASGRAFSEPPGPDLRARRVARLSRFPGRARTAPSPRADAVAHHADDSQAPAPAPLAARSRHRARRARAGSHAPPPGGLRPAAPRAATRRRALPFPSSASCCSSAGVLNLWALDRNGWANQYYSAAVRSMSSSWHNFLYDSFDPSGLMTVDKPPLALWVQALSARVFGFHSWSILVPQALMGVATVALVYDLTRRMWGRTAGFVAGLVLAVTPITVAISRHNNPDALLALCCVGALWCLVRAFRTAARAGSCSRACASASASRRRWAPPCWSSRDRRGVAVGGPRGRLAAVRQLLAGGAAMVVVGGAWPLLMALTPASSRPWISGTSDNSILSLILDYNGLGRLDGQAGGPQNMGGGGPGGGTTFGGATGPLRLLNEGLGGQAGWLLGLRPGRDRRPRGGHAPAARGRPHRLAGRHGRHLPDHGRRLQLRPGDLPSLLRRAAGALHGGARRRGVGLVPVAPPRRGRRRRRGAGGRRGDRAARPARPARSAHVAARGPARRRRGDGRGARRRPRAAARRRPRGRARAAAARPRELGRADARPLPPRARSPRAARRRPARRRRPRPRWRPGGGFGAPPAPARASARRPPGPAAAAAPARPAAPAAPAAAWAAAASAATTPG